MLVSGFDPVMDLIRGFGIIINAMRRIVDVTMLYVRDTK